MVPKKIVVYSQYGCSVYFDGKLKEHQGTRPRDLNEWVCMGRLLGIEVEIRYVRWEDWPRGVSACHNPPEDIRVLEEHFSTLELRKLNNEIERTEDCLDALRVKRKELCEQLHSSC